MSTICTGQLWRTPTSVLAVLSTHQGNGKGPVPFDAAQAVLLAEQTGIGVSDAARACFGDREHADQPEGIRPLYGSRVLAYRQLDDLRERLMPGDPADLWTTGLAVQEAAEWWNRHTHSAG